MSSVRTEVQKRMSTPEVAIVLGMVASGLLARGVSASALELFGRAATGVLAEAEVMNFYSLRDLAVRLVWWLGAAEDGHDSALRRATEANATDTAVDHGLPMVSELEVIRDTSRNTRALRMHYG